MSAPTVVVACEATHAAVGTHRQWWQCDLRTGHTGDHASIAPNCNFRRGFQVVQRWPNPTK